MSILRYENVDWALPGLFGCEPEFINIKNLFDQIEVPFKCNIFGTPKIKWSGGRIPFVSIEDKKFVRRLFYYLTSIQITPSLTFTNYNISKEDLEDPLCNYILDVANDYNCNILVSSDILFDYIKNKYPSICCTASVVKASYKFQTPKKAKNPDYNSEMEFYNELLKTYDKVVVRPEFAKYYLPDNYKKIDDVSRIEVLINQCCYPNCPIATEHYKAFENCLPNFKCYVDRKKLSILEQFESNLLLTIDEVDNLVNNIGIKHLKLQSLERSKITAPVYLFFYSYILKQDTNAIVFADILDEKIVNTKTFFKNEILQNYQVFT